MRALLLLVVLAGCDHAAAQNAPKPAPKRLKVAWSKVKATPGCFFFSGPDGRDIQLTGMAMLSQSGTEVTLTFAKATFRGSLTDGGFEVTRRGAHDFDGPWTVEENIRGGFAGTGVVARYRYTECQQGTKCPNTCTIEAELALRP